MLIDSFEGKYRFLSNFYAQPVTFEGILYPSVEHAYQAAKTMDLQERAYIATLTAGKAKRAGRKLVLRSDWEAVKLTIMEQLVLDKFSNSEHLWRLLMATGNDQLVEGNWWGDTYWGVCRGIGQNHLGKILMKVRTALQSSTGFMPGSPNDEAARLAAHG
jgi:ribA/ribD-fused uncharacterized protein